MMVTLSEEQRRALQSGQGSPITVRDVESDAIYVLVDAHTHERAMEALEREASLASVRRGVAQMEAGLGRPASDAEAELRSKHGLPPRQ